MRKKATHKGKCVLCGFKGALMEDGSVYRHYAGVAAPEDMYPDGICKGWGRQPLNGTVEPL